MSAPLVYFNIIPIVVEGAQTIDSDELKKKVQLKKSISLLNSITIIVGTIIGSGIFVSPTGIIKNVRSVGASLIIWALCGVFSLFGAYSYAELGTLIPKSGGDYIYVYEAFGSFIGFLRLWVEVMVIKPTSVAAIAIIFGQYVVQPIFPDCEQSYTLIRLLAAVCISKFRSLIETCYFNMHRR